MRQCVAGLLALLVVGTASAEIYQCDENGRKVFSQQPCGEDAKVVRTDAERTVELKIRMSQTDISFLCGRAMRSWERSMDQQRNNRAGYNYRYYGSSEGNSDERRRAFILSAISNLERLATEDSDLYEIGNSLASRYYVNASPGSYNYDAELKRAKYKCETDLAGSLRRLEARRNNATANNR